MALSGSGVVYSYTAVRQVVNPEYEGDTPFILVDVALEEGLRMLARLEGGAPLAIGAPVQVVFRKLRAGHAILPCFVVVAP
jgi:uncharacterized OB-fold protein